MARLDMIAETQRLRDAGLPHGQAEAVTLAIHAGVTGGVATKADLEVLRGDFKALRGDVSRDIEALRGDIRRLDTDLKWIKAIGGVIVAILVLPWLAGILGVALPGP